MSTAAKKRIFKFDNVKFFAILLVVIGHTIEVVARDNHESDLFLCLFTFIYSFHMPLFIFISGLFTKRLNKNDRFDINKFTFYILTGFFLKCYRVIINKICHSPAKSGLIGTSSIEWFMFVLGFCYLACYLLRKVKPYISLPCSVIAGCLIGLVDFSKITFVLVNKEPDFFYLSRFFVFFPFFLAGYYLIPRVLLDFTSKLYVKIPSIVLFVAYFIICFRIDLSKYIGLFTGRNPYDRLREDIPSCFMQHRLIAYLVSGVLILGVLSLIPNIRIPIISHMGQNTLSTYFWHSPLIKLSRYLGLFALFKSFGDPMWKILYLTFAVILTLVLSTDLFNWPLKKLKEICDDLKPTAAYAILAILFTASLLIYYFIIA